MARDLANELRKERKLKEDESFSIHINLPIQLEQHTPEKQKQHLPQKNYELYNIITGCKAELQDEAAALQALRLLDCDPEVSIKRLEQEKRDQELARKIQLLETSPKLTQEEIDKKLAMEAQDEGN